MPAGLVSAQSSSGRPACGFTLIELLVSMTFLVILMLVVTQVVGVVQRTWVRANSRVSQFREARVAFDTLSRNLSQATLNTYWENEFDPLGKDSAGQTIKKARNYVRQSELQYISGPSNLVLAGTSKPEDYPGHAVFFQAPLGVARLVASTGTQVNTENMVNLMCGRGYFVEWGSDETFRPAFLDKQKTVKARSRLRLMEYSPTAEMNRIYDGALRPLVDNELGITHSKEWFNTGTTSVINSKIKQGETVATRYFTRPIAENILALIISPQVETTGNTGVLPYSIAPQYLYDSTLKANPGATVATGSQGTQHLLPPLLKITMIALDEKSGEFLSREENDDMRKEILTATSGLFTRAATFQEDLDGSDGKQGTLETLLLSKRLNYRLFTTTLALKQGRWSF